MINVKHQLLGTALILILGAHASLANAQSKDGRPPHGPPPEAISACEGAAAGDACTFSGRNSEEVTGTCSAPPEGDEQLSCAPEGGHPKRGNKR